MTATRQIFGEDTEARTRGRVLVGAQAGSFALILMAVVTQAPVGVELAAVAVSLAAIVVAATTQRRLARLDARRRAHAEATIDLAGSMLMAIDRSGRVRMANPAACAVIGRPEADVLGEHIHERIIAGEDAARSREALARVLRGEIDPTGYRSVRTIVRPAGDERQVAWTFNLRHDEAGEISGLVICGEDVTQQLVREAAEQSERGDLEQLRRLAQDVAATDDARGAVVERVRALVDATFAGLAEVDTDGGVTFTAATDARLPGQRVAPGERSGCLHVIETGKPLVVGDATTHQHVHQGLLELTGCTAMRYEPVLSSGRVVAVLAVGWVDRQPAVDARREQLLALAADETAIAITRLKTLRRLEAIALTDPLTGIANRRAFDAELGRAIARAGRKEAPLSLAVLDLNEFKALNDRSGHDAGDALLAACAGAWEAELRAGDLLARLGGDEFAVILPDCGSEATAALIARLHRATPHAPGSSIGFATWTAESAHELYQLADRALYKDKARRRRRRLADVMRLAAVEATDAWHGVPQEAIQRLAEEARELLDLPSIYVNLVGEHEMRHIVRPDADPHAVRPTDDSYCQHVVSSGKPFVIADSYDEPAVQGSTLIDDIRAYAGMPLADADGNVLGAICAADSQPREWDPVELRVLDKIALRVARELSAGAREPLGT